MSFLRTRANASALDASERTVSRPLAKLVTVDPKPRWRDRTRTARPSSSPNAPVRRNLVVHRARFSPPSYSRPEEGPRQHTLAMLTAKLSKLIEVSLSDWKDLIVTLKICQLDYPKKYRSNSQENVISNLARHR